MKKLSFMLMIALAVYAFQGCHNGSKDAKETADSLNKTKDTTGNTAATGGIAVNRDDAKFATSACEGSLAEVALGKLALQKSANDKIKNFANMMITDHSKANDSLAVIAVKKNITLPIAVSADDQKAMDSLNNKTGKDFDKAYVAAMIAGHKGALKLFQDAEKNCSDADLKAFATKTAPTVQMHLDAINKINADMK
jgi:putative membrane protein